MQKIITTKTTLSESYFGGWKTEIQVSTILGESFKLTNSWQPGQLYSGFNHHCIPTVVSRPLAIWLTRQEWAIRGYLVVEGDELKIVQPNTSFWYPQPDTKYTIAKIA